MYHHGRVHRVKVLSLYPPLAMLEHARGSRATGDEPCGSKQQYFRVRSCKAASRRARSPQSAGPARVRWTRRPHKSKKSHRETHNNRSMSSRGGRGRVGLPRRARQRPHPGGLAAYRCAACRCAAGPPHTAPPRRPCSEPRRSESPTPANPVEGRGRESSSRFQSRAPTSW